MGIKKQITYENYYDKVYGGWLGKCIGGAAGAPIEGVKKLIEHEHFREVFRWDLPNDDLDLQLLWLEVLQEKGLDLTSRDMADAWNKKCWYPFSEYGIFLKNYERGIYPPYSGSFNNPLFCEGEGSPIRSEIWGMIFPGEPEMAVEYAKMDSQIDHTGISLWIEQFYAAIEAEAFFEEDITKLIADNIKYLPECSRPRTCVQEVCQYYAAGNRDWIKAREALMRRYAHFDFTNAVTNLGIVMIALLYGNGDMDQVINIAFRCGYDADCTAATAGAICGIIVGKSHMDAKLLELVEEEFVVGIDVDRTDNTISALTQETCAIGILGRERCKTVITEIPRTVTVPAIMNQSKKVEMTVSYEHMPAIGYADECTFSVKIVNCTKEFIQDELYIKNLPVGWILEQNKMMLTIPAGREVIIKNTVYTDVSTAEIHNTNLITVCFGENSYEFGIAGASVFKAIGPYFEALEKEDRKGLPSPHGAGCDLPNLECMVNNAVYLDKEYCNERNFTEVFDKSEIIINGYEDLLPLDDEFTFYGQGCIYLEQTIVSPEDRELWAVIGNNDGFKLWVNDELIMERDEIRLWTPYNNYELFQLKKGENKIHLKLLRRTESLKYSFGLRKYEGEHFHRKRWYVDFSSKA